MDENPSIDEVIKGLLTGMNVYCRICHRALTADEQIIADRSQTAGGNLVYRFGHHCPDCKRTAGLVVECHSAEPEEIVTTRTPLPSWVPVDIFNEPA